MDILYYSQVGLSRNDKILALNSDAGQRTDTVTLVFNLSYVGYTN